MHVNIFYCLKIKDVVCSIFIDVLSFYRFLCIRMIRFTLVVIVKNYQTHKNNTKIVVSLKQALFQINYNNVFFKQSNLDTAYYQYKANIQDICNNSRMLRYIVTSLIFRHRLTIIIQIGLFAFFHAQNQANNDSLKFRFKHFFLFVSVF